jgi:putative membrane protein
MEKAAFKAGRVIAGLMLTGLVASQALAQSTMSTQDFANATAQSDQYEIQAGRVAVTQSQNAQVRTFAQQMIDDHTRTSEDLQKAAAASGLPPLPKVTGGDQQKMLSALQSMKGTDFDRAFVTQQVMAHTSALVTEQAYAASGSDPRIKAVAQSSVPLIQRHLDMARQMKASMGN